MGIDEWSDIGRIATIGYISIPQALEMHMLLRVFIGVTTTGIN